MKKKLLVILFSLVTLGLVSCGGGNDVASTSGNQMSPVAAAMVIATNFSVASVEQTLLFNPSTTWTCGVITSLSIGGNGGITLSANLPTNMPTNQCSSGSAAVGAIRSFYWEGGPTQPLVFTFFVDRANQVALLNLLNAGVPSAAVSIDFAVQSYDPTYKTYYPAISTNSQTLNGYISKEGTRLELAVDVIPTSVTSSNSVLSLYAVHLSISPPTLLQAIFRQASFVNKWVSQWGIALPNIALPN